MSGRRRLALVMCAATATGCGSSGPERDGPLQTDPASLGYEAVKPAGRAFTFGGMILYTQPGTTPDEIELLEVRPQATTADVEVVGVRVATTKRQNMAAFVTESSWPVPVQRGFGPIGPTPEARGYRFRPSAETDFTDGIGVELLIGLRTRAAGRFAIRGVRARYRHGDREYDELLPLKFTWTAEPPKRR